MDNLNKKLLLLGLVGALLTAAAPLAAQEVIVDNASANVQDPAGGRTYGGLWCAAAVADKYGADALYSCGSGTDVYRWTPNIPSAGNYQVYLWWNTEPGNGTSVPVNVMHADGVTGRSFNQRVGGGQWVLHGSYRFVAGRRGFVQLSDANGRASADAVRLVRVGTTPANTAFQQVIMKENYVDGAGNKVELSTWTMAGGTYVNTPARSGSHAVRVVQNGAPTLFWTSGFLTNYSLAPFEAFTFWIYSAVANPAISVTATWQSNVDTGDINTSRREGPRVALPGPISANTWTKVTVPIAALIPDAANRHSVAQLALHGSVAGAVYVDDLTLEGSHAASAIVKVDSGSVVRAVDRRVIGTGLAYWNGDNNTDRIKGYADDLKFGALRYVSDTNVRKFTPGGFANSISLIKANPQAALYTILHGWNAALDVPATVAEAKALVAYLRLPAASVVLHSVCYLSDCWRG